MTDASSDSYSDLEFGSLSTTFAVDIDTSGDRTVARITEQTTDGVSGSTVLTEYDLDPQEAQSVIKTLQDALEQNDERNVVGYPTDVSTVGDTTVNCPQCHEPIGIDTTMTCPECGAQLELATRVTATGRTGALPPK